MLRNFNYHFALWLSILVLFLFLEFFKVVDDLLSGLGWSTISTNIGVIALFCWPTAFFVGGASMGVERLLGLRTVHALAIFTFVSVNLWPLKVELAAQLEQVRPEPRAWIAACSLLVALSLTVFIWRKIDTPVDRWYDLSPWVVKGWAAVTLLSLGCGILLNRGPEERSTSDKPSIIIITVDSLGARNLSMYGYEKATTPNLDKLAKQGFFFERFHSNFNVTGLALPALNGYLSQTPQGATLVESLGNAGYPNRAYFGFWAPELLSLRGFNHSHLTRSGMKSLPYRMAAQVFTEPELRWLAGLLTHEFTYFNPYTSKYHDDIFWTKQHYPPELSLQAGLDYIRANPKGSLVWVHLWPPHFPYVPTSASVGMFGSGPEEMRPWINASFDESMDPYVAALRTLYDRSVFETDLALGQFFDGLQTSELMETSYVIFTSDHGESFGRGWVGHSGWPLVEAITHVPFIMRLPGKNTPIRVQTIAQQLDFAPTLLSLLELPIPPGMQGESLIPYLQSPEQLSENYKVSVSLRASTGEGGQLAVYWKRYKLVFVSTVPDSERLFDLFEDPEARIDIAEQHPEIVKDMKARLRI